MSPLITQYIHTINNLPNGTIDELLRTVYSKDILFIDPAHTITGIDALSNYFTKLYTNTIDCTFELQHYIQQEQTYALHWTMHLSHPRLKKGQPIAVNGASFLNFDDNNMITKHQDFFDLGAMLYENVSIIGGIIRFIKGRL